MSTHPKYSQARNYTTYALVSMKGVVYVHRTVECQNKRGRASPIEDYASGSLHLAACRREYIEVLQVASHIIILPGGPPLIALRKSDHRVVCGTWKGVFY